MEEPRVAHGDDGRRLPSLKPGEVFEKRYQVEKLLGRGLFGEVYQVKHIRYGQTLVLKVFYPGIFPDEKSRQAFKAEFEKIRQSRPGVARYFEQGDWNEARTKYCTMEFVNGSSLRTLMAELKKQGKQLSVQDSLQILIKMVDTLRTLHQAGISHRNIKPENILIVAKGRAVDKVQWDVRISDFALAHAPVDWMTEIASDKLPYMPPELRGYGGQIGPKADIYSVGAILYEMLTGSPPEPGAPPPTSRRSSLNKKFDDIADLSLAEMPSDRYSSIQDLLFELEQLQATIPYEEERTPFNWKVPVLVVAGLAVLAGAIAFILTRESETTEDLVGPARWEKIRSTIKDDPQALLETAEQIAARAGKEPGMIYIPPGSYLKGAFLDEPHRQGQETTETKDAEGKVRIPVKQMVHGYYIDQHEFPNEKGKMPVTAKSWDDAEKLCNNKGKRLCTDDEWERACKGENFQIYGYGDTYDAAKCPPVTGKPFKAGENAECRNSFDVFDMAGNVPEWINAAPISGADRRLVKGGRLGGDQAPVTRCAAFQDENMNIADPSIGFRCCK